MSTHQPDGTLPPDYEDVVSGNVSPEEARILAAALAAHRQEKAEAEAAKREADRRREATKALLGQAADGETPRLTVYEAMQETDLTEGKGGRVAQGAFLFEEDAVDAHYVLEGVMGAKNWGNPREVDVFLDFETWLEGAVHDPQTRLNSARIGEVSARRRADRERIDRLTS